MPHSVHPAVTNSVSASKAFPLPAFLCPLQRGYQPGGVDEANAGKASVVKEPKLIPELKKSPIPSSSTLKEGNTFHWLSAVL